jgi:hypothetical protein
VLTANKGIYLVIVVTLLLNFPYSLEARSRNPLRKAHIHFLATSTVIRGTWGTNEDVYLVELRLSSKGESVLVRLIDEYSSDFPPLSAEALTSPAGTVLRVRRDARCDIPYGTMPLRTAPGDPKAILHERLGFEPTLNETPAAKMTLPCYRTARQ